MKLKKFKFGLIFILSVFAFSCASTPKIQNTPEPETEELPAESEQAQDISPASETEKNTDTSDSIEDADESTFHQDDVPYEDFLPETERIEPDELEELPELEEDAENPIVELEPVIEPEIQETVSENTEAEKEIKPQEENNPPEDTEENSAAEQKSDSPVDTESENESLQDEKVSETEKNTEYENISAEPDYELEEKKEIIPSRSITIGKNQLINIVYPGKGWIYQGNIDSEGNIDSRGKNFIFGGRKLGGVDQSFTLRSRTSGKFLLHFFKNDGLTGDYIDDYLEVIVDESKSSMPDAVTVPSYADIVPPKISITAEKIKEQQKYLQKEEKAEILEGGKTKEQKDSLSQKKNTTEITDIPKQTDERISTTIQTTQAAQVSASPAAQITAPAAGGQNQTSVKTTENQKSESQDDFSDSKLEKMNEDNLLKTAQNLYDSKDYENALKVITKFFDKASGKIDRGLYLQGQILEAKSSVQNIKDAIESYDLLVKNYPASPLWDKANKRKIFLRRFYINIR